MKKLLTILSAILIPLGATAITISIIAVKESKYKSILIPDEIIENVLEEIVEDQSFESTDAVIKEIEAATNQYITEIEVDVKAETIDNRAAISKLMSFQVDLTPAEGYELESDEEFIIKAEVDQPLMSVYSSKVQSDLESIIEGHGNNFDSEQEVINTLESYNKDNSIVEIEAKLKLESTSKREPISKKTAFEITVSPKDGYKLFGPNILEITANVNQPLIEISRNTIQTGLDIIVKNEKFNSNDEVIKALEEANIDNIKILNIELKPESRIGIHKEREFEVTVEPEKGYKLENDEPFIVKAIAIQPETLVSWQTIQDGLTKQASSKTYLNNDTANATIGFTKIEGIKIESVTPLATTKNAKNNVQVMDDGTTITVNNISFEVKVSALDGYKLENNNPFNVSGKVLSINRELEDKETVYVDNDDSIKITNKNTLRDSNAKELIKFGVFENGKTTERFYGEVVPDSLPREITSLNSFAASNKNEKIIGMENWDTSNVTDMTFLFYNANNFNQDIGNWDTSNVTDMESMLQNTEAFNQDIGDWNTSNVTNMEFMFSNAKKFNKDIGDWKTIKVNSMMAMFQGTNLFNQDIGDWNTSNVKDMAYMFGDAFSFNKDIGNWNTSNVTNMDRMFSDAIVFNQDIGNWNTSNVTNMDHMFVRANKFNQNIGNWNTSNVINMESMFEGAIEFNQNLSEWDVANVASYQKFDSETSVNWTTDKKPKFKWFDVTKNQFVN